MGVIRPSIMSVQRPAPIAMKPPLPPPDPVRLVAQLGTATRINMDGSVQYNEPLVQSLIGLREQALPAINLLLGSTNSTATILEALYAATKMAEAGVVGVNQLYPSVSRLNSHIDPAVQVHLAQFYGKINEPKAFGPMLTTAIHYAANQYPMGSYAAYRFTEEAGAAFLNQLARQTAQETVRALLPFLRPPGVPATAGIPTGRKPV